MIFEKRPLPHEPCRVNCLTPQHVRIDFLHRGRRNIWVDKSERRCSQILPADVERQPPAPLHFRHRARCVRTSENIHYEIIWVGQESDEKLRQPRRESGRVLLGSHHLTCPQIPPITFGVRNLQQIGRNRPAVVLPESVSNVVAARPLRWSIESGWILNEFLHSLAVGSQHFFYIRLRPCVFRKPPNRVHGVLCPQLPLVHPFDRRRQLCRIMPVKVLCQLETQLITELEQHPERI